MLEQADPSILTARPARAPGVVVFALLTGLMSLFWLWEGVVLKYGRVPWEADYRVSPDSGTWLVPASFGLALLCLISGVGLLFRKQWARVTVLGLMGFWLIVGLLGVGKATYLVAFDPQISSALSGWPGVRFIGFLGIVLICIPAGYLSYFSRRAIKRLFTCGRCADNQQLPKQSQ